MAQKTTVTITADGFSKTISSDAVIVFTVDKVHEFQSGEVEQLESSTGYVGVDIPDSFFAKAIAKMLGAVIKGKSEGDPIKESLNLHMVSGYLEDESETVVQRMTPQQQLRAMDHALKEMRKFRK